MDAGSVSKASEVAKNLPNWIKLLISVVILIVVIAIVYGIYMVVSAPFRLIGDAAKDAGQIFGADGCKDKDGNLENPILPKGTCCRYDANCNNPNSCMYCDPSDGNSYSLVGNYSEGTVVPDKDGGRYCASSRVCGDFSEIQPAQYLDKGTCCEWDTNKNNSNSCMYCHPSDGNSYSLVGTQPQGANVDKYNGKYCSTSRVCGDFSGIQEDQYLDSGTCCEWDTNKNNPNSCMFCKPSDGNSYSLVGTQPQGANVDKYDGKYCSTSRKCGK